MKSRVPRRWIVAIAAVLLLVWLAPMAMAGGGGDGKSKEDHGGKHQEAGEANSDYAWIALMGLGGTMLVGFVAAKSFKGEVPASNDHGHGASHDDH